MTELFPQAPGFTHGVKESAAREGRLAFPAFPLPVSRLIDCIHAAQHDSEHDLHPPSAGRSGRRGHSGA